MKFTEAYEEVKAAYSKMGYTGPISLMQTHKVLFELTQRLAPQRYGEIGSHIGCSLSYVSLASPDAVLYSYDSPNSGYGGEGGTEGWLEKAMGTFAPNRHTLNFGKSQSSGIRSKISANGPYDVFMIDGDHSSEGCLADFNTVLPAMTANGVIVIDDLIHHKNLGDLFDKIVTEGNFKFEKFMEKDETVLRGVGVIYL